MALSKIQAESMNLADTYAFSGTVSGAGGGKVLQMKTSGNIRSAFNTASETYQTMNTTVAITPSSTSSRIMVWANVSGAYIYGGQGGSGDDGASGAIYRGSTEIYGSGERFLYHRDASAASMEIAMPCILQALDSPSSTSEIVYGIYMRAWSGSTVNATNHDRSIIVMEIGA